MWRNMEFADFLKTMRGWNEERSVHDRLELRGLEVYSLHRSRDEVLTYLDRVYPQEAVAARRRYSFLTPFLDEPQAYGAHAQATGRNCEDALLEQRMAYAAKEDGEKFFDAEQNARVICAAARSAYEHRGCRHADCRTLSDRTPLRRGRNNDGSITSADASICGYFLRRAGLS